uniref:Uncharacterized protein n=1 Tax=Leptospira santarosai serovar Arenal str. MAVJ 401 TaxID=1049976 RepID=M6JP51_9LEPT|nr:hypothetical protein LEP1GSC063_0471 [Leptospira santarosai serovar Arenal str. MAVJ 401]
MSELPRTFCSRIRFVERANPDSFHFYGPQVVLEEKAIESQGPQRSM